LAVKSTLETPPAEGSRSRRLRAIKFAILTWQQLLARSLWASQLYLAIISLLCRQLFSENISRHIGALAVGSGTRWPMWTFAAKSVRIGKEIKIKLIPHLGEFDQAVLFDRRLRYEAEVFNWLEREAAVHYDAVIEIGANVGVYSIFFDALIKTRPGCRLRTIASFEPSLEAFQRLLANLQVNDATLVLPFRAAVADMSGFRYFFEPRGHLTNGSFIENFAGIFSDVVEKRVVAVHAAADLEFFFRAHSKVLVKVDVEGYEPELLRALQDIITRYRPDLIIEVLEGTPAGVEVLPWIEAYQRYLIAPTGLQLHSELTADQQCRDWLLRACPDNLNRSNQI
jgi:FkbM family methyltransferase